MALRMMIVEDNLLTREMIKDMLDILGHQVVAEADDLAGALAAYRQHQPDALTIDLSLPKEDGLTILR
ncbi:MAG: response regulator, partial [Elusimicrobia bacterium]|nr:response regulator [Elusimicrobiota bacterium]